MTYRPEPTWPPRNEVCTELITELDAVRAREESIRQRLSAIRQKRQLLEDVNQFIAQGRPGAAWRLISSADKAYERIRKAGGDVPPVLATIREAAKRAAEEAAQNFGRHFPEAIRKRGEEPDKSSRHPKYTFRNGFLTVELNEPRLTVRVAPRDGRPEILGVDVEPVADYVDKEARRLFDRSFDAEAFTQALFDAYQRTIKEERGSLGDDVRIRGVLEQVTAGTKTRMDELNIDLGRLLKAEDQPSVDGRRIKVSHTRKEREGILIHGMESRGYIGFISFK